jgi:HAD superfamily hydrolase (TIGR01549 family)
MSSRWSPFYKQLVVIVSLAACVWVIFRVEALWIPVILMLLLAYLVSLPVNAILHHTGWPRTFVAALVYLFVILLIVLTPALLLPRLVTLVRGFGITLANVIAQLLQAKPEPLFITPSLTLDPGILYAPINQWLTGILDPGAASTLNPQDLLFPFATRAAVFVRSAVSGVVTVFFVLVLSFYLVKDWTTISRFVMSRMPEPMLPELRRLWSELSRVWDAFVRGQIILGLTMGVVVWITMSILGVHNAPALGLLFFLGEFVPGVGPVVAGITGSLIALILGSTWLPLPNLWFAIVVALVYFLLGQIENMYIQPRVVGRRIALHPIVVILGALAGAQLAGILGILLAAPLIASVRVLFGYTYHKLADEAPFPPQEGQIDQRLFWDELLQRRPIGAVLFDLDGTLIETDDQIVDLVARRFRFLERLLPSNRRMDLARRWLMTSEILVNGLITLLDRLGLDGLLFRMDYRFRRWRGIREPENFVAVAGSSEMLHKLARRLPLAIVTSRSREEATAFLSQYQLDCLFAAVVTRDDVKRLKPHPMPVQAAATKLNVPVEACVLVGDTTVDVRAAKAAGALAVGVLCGFGEQLDLQAADLVIESSADLMRWL